MTRSICIDQRAFLETSATVGTVFGLAGTAIADESSTVRVGVIGCGNVSNSYMKHLSKSPHVDLVSACDIILELAKGQAEKFAIPN